MRRVVDRRRHDSLVPVSAIPIPIAIPSRRRADATAAPGRGIVAIRGPRGTSALGSLERR
jgi:hypothetical protein